MDKGYSELEYHYKFKKKKIINLKNDTKTWNMKFVSSMETNIFIILFELNVKSKYEYRF